MTALKSFAPELDRLQVAYLAAKFADDMVKEIDRKCCKRVLARRPYFSTFDGTRITNPDHSYHMTDEDFDGYLREVFAEHKKAGLTTPNYETTADYATWPARKQAEKELIAFGLKIAPAHMREDLGKVAGDLEGRKKMIELLLRLDLTL